MRSNFEISEKYFFIDVEYVGSLFMDSLECIILIPVSATFCPDYFSMIYAELLWK